MFFQLSQQKKFKIPTRKEMSELPFIFLTLDAIYILLLFFFMFRIINRKRQRDFMKNMGFKFFNE